MAAREGKPASEVHRPAAWKAEAKYLALGLYDTIVHWSPELVVLGGPMMRDISIADVQSELAKLPPVYGEWPPFVHAKLGDDGGLHGAMALSKQLSL